MQTVSKESEGYLPLKHISYNHNGDHMIILSRKGFDIFQTNPLQKKFHMETSEVEIVEMVCSTNFIGYVKRGSVFIYDFSKKEILCEIGCGGKKIKSLRFTLKYVILVFEDSVIIYDRNYMDRKYWYFKTAINVDGVCCSSLENDVFAVPSPEKIGEVLVCDIKEKSQIKVVAHGYPLRCLAITFDGSVLATASDNGRNIKLIDCKKAKVVKTLRRGLSSRTMYSMTFSSNGKSLCCFSNSGTVHLFSTSDGNENKNKTATFYPLSYLGISYFSSEWSNQKFNLDKMEFGRVKFKPNSENVIYCCNEKASFVEINFEGENPERKEFEIFKELSASNPNFPIGHIPLVLEPKLDSKLASLEQRKFYVPKNLKVGNFAFSVGKRFNLKEGELKFYVEENNLDVIVQDQMFLYEVYEKYKKSDEYLYLKYSEK